MSFQIIFDHGFTIKRALYTTPVKSEAVDVADNSGEMQPTGPPDNLNSAQLCPVNFAAVVEAGDGGYPASSGDVNTEGSSVVVRPIPLVIAEPLSAFVHRKRKAETQELEGTGSGCKHQTNESDYNIFQELVESHDKQKQAFKAQIKEIQDQCAVETQKALLANQAMDRMKWMHAKELNQQSQIFTEMAKREKAELKAQYECTNAQARMEYERKIFELETKIVELKQNIELNKGTGQIHEAINALRDGIEQSVAHLGSFRSLVDELKSKASDITAKAADMQNQTHQMQGFMMGVQMNRSALAPQFMFRQQGASAALGSAGVGLPPRPPTRHAFHEQDPHRF